MDDNGNLEIDHAACIAYGPDCEEICITACPTDIIHHPGQQPDPNKRKVKKPVKKAAKAEAEEGAA